MSVEAHQDPKRETPDLSAEVETLSHFFADPKFKNARNPEPKP